MRASAPQIGSSARKLCVRVGSKGVLEYFQTIRSVDGQQRVARHLGATEANSAPDSRCSCSGLLPPLPREFLRA